MTTTLNINGATVSVDVDPETPLLWVLRDTLGLTGSKYSCGIGLCGSCRVLLDQRVVSACRLKVADAAGHAIMTIEGLSESAAQHPLLQAWESLQVPQCGYCQSGQIITAYALLQTHPNPSDQQIDDAMSGVLCRCGSYPRIKTAIREAARQLSAQEPRQ
ncbi:MAG: (2Fe-2S)-binding protein [Candidatus Thiodiazotropha sp.]